MPFAASTGGCYGYGRPVQRPAAGGGGGSGPSGSMRINIIGDASIATMATGIAAARTALGYSNVTITYTSTLLSNYTGANLTTANFDSLLVWTNGGVTLNTSFGTNLNSYITSGGPVVFGMFCWGNVSAIPNFTYTNSPYAFNGNQTSLTGTMVKSIAHPITNNISTTIISGTTYATPSVTVQTNASSIAAFSAGTSMVATQTAPRRVAVNLYPLTGTVDAYRLFLNSLLWSGGLLN